MKMALGFMWEQHGWVKGATGNANLVLVSQKWSGRSYSLSGYMKSGSYQVYYCLSNVRFLSLGEVLGCLESCKAMHTIDLCDLCVTLDIFVLTLPLEIEMVNDLHHNRWGPMALGCVEGRFKDGFC